MIHSLAGLLPCADGQLAAMATTIPILACAHRFRVDVLDTVERQLPAQRAGETRVQCGALTFCCLCTGALNWLCFLVALPRALCSEAHSHLDNSG